MGILGLAKLISEETPAAIIHTSLDSYFEKKIAIDASLYLYQFLVAVRSDGDQLKSNDGGTTSHLLGMFYTNIRLLENGIRPVYVFDGKPPALKASKLDKREERRNKAREQLKQAQNANDTEGANKYSRQLVKLERKHIIECKKLLRLLGIPYIVAPGEAEAQCAELVRTGKVYATATEDMDALVFGSRVLLRNTLSAAQKGKTPIKEYRLDSVLEGLRLNQSQFVDLAILLGCDYCDTVRGVGAKTAINLVRSDVNIEAMLENSNWKWKVPVNWAYKEARELFSEPEVVDFYNLEFKWTEPYEEGLVKYLCGEKQFSEQRVRNGLKRLKVSGDTRSFQTANRPN